MPQTEKPKEFDDICFSDIIEEEGHFPMPNIDELEENVVDQHQNDVMNAVVVEDAQAQGVVEPFDPDIIPIDNNHQLLITSVIQYLELDTALIRAVVR